MNEVEKVLNKLSEKELKVLIKTNKYELIDTINSLITDKILDKTFGSIEVNND